MGLANLQGGASVNPITQHIHLDATGDSSPIRSIATPYWKRVDADKINQ